MECGVAVCTLIDNDMHHNSGQNVVLKTIFTFVLEDMEEIWNSTVYYCLTTVFQSVHNSLMWESPLSTNKGYACND